MRSITWTRRDTPRVLAGLAFAALLCACGDRTLEEVDPEAAPARPTWSEHIEVIVVDYCTACHAEDAQPGEVAGYGFETCAKVKRHWRAFVESAFEEGTMPPGAAPRVRAADELALRRWWEQGATCE